MNIIRNIVVAAVMALALAGCQEANAPTTNQTAPQDTQTLTLDEIFIKVVHEQIPQVRNVSDDILIDSAHDVCDTFERVGVSPETVGAAADGFVDGGNGLFTMEDAGSFFGASTATYCPAVNRELNDTLDNSPSA